MIIQAFLRWVETAKASDRARAASALGRAYAASEMNTLDRHAAEMAMTFLLDDPSPKVRIALAGAVADCAAIPRAIVLSLAEDQPEAAFAVISRSPVLTDMDLVDLAARGTHETRAVIAARPHLSRPVAAAIAEIGGEEEVLILLENPAAEFSSRALKRLSDRLGHLPSVRNYLLDRPDLPVDARHTLVEKVSAALSGFSLVQMAIGERRVERITREACDTVAVGMAGSADASEVSALVEHLRVCGRLTPAFLMHALCSGRIDFFAAAICDLSGVSEKRVRSVLSNGRVHAVRALFEQAGLGRDVSQAFADALFLWRKDNHQSGSSIASMSATLLSRLRRRVSSEGPVGGLAEMVEKLSIAEQRQSAREYALLAAREAA
ncbi:MULTISPECIES: DUF2336 domain-containing protein [unclassified Rhizobium]|uniref:DUF2336 domain-containing protein n=1 Tax=unclassified Rhizobium TaxID=2613769 RepID=UPI0006F97F17|nr:MULTISPECIES: DUF2336 domain-containing protein [unclassified Rhizobium]KQV42522.1 hypothetical protein ASC86_19510 [Rhizobium sp. Root1212]KRD21448.1 hypothetical protein ASE37_18085 [Rhizobium sp. Root268]